MAYKYGYLQKKAKVWYKTWVERFYVLSNIGLIYMDNPNAKEIKVFQCVDFDVLKIPKAEYNRQWVLRIKNRQEVGEVVLQAYNEQDYWQWLEAFEKFRQHFMDAKKKLKALKGQ